MTTDSVEESTIKDPIEEFEEPGMDPAIDYVSPGARIALVGPSGSGKTLLSLGLRVFSLPDQDSCGLRIRSRLDADQLRLASDMRAAARMEPTADSAVQYELDVDLPASRRTIFGEVQRLAWLARHRMQFLSLLQQPRQEQELTVRVQLVDGPGSVFFPLSSQENNTFNCGPKLKSLVESAQALILCINATRPELTAIYSGLPVFLAEMSQSDGYLPYRAVLVLLTHVDCVAGHFMEVLRAYPSAASTPALRFLREHPAASPLYLGQHIDAGEWARSLVGDKLLCQLWNYLAPGAKFGIGIASVPGFDRYTGAPFVDGDSAVFNSNWKPLGLEEALYFALNDGLAQDRCLGTIVEYIRDKRSRPPEASSTKIFLEASA